MRICKTSENRVCPRCGARERQANNGRNRSGTQRVLCRLCQKTYTLDPKPHVYSEETRELACKTYYAGASARAVGNILHMDKENVVNWIKKNRTVGG